MTDVLDVLRRDGCSLVDWAPDMARSLRGHLMVSRTCTAHVIPQGDGVERTLFDALNQAHPMCCHPMVDVLATPGLFDYLAKTRPIADGYFGEPASLYSVNAFWKKPGGPAGWHHDTDDGKVLALFMFGTDVSDAEGGVHAYVAGSHEWSRDTLRPWHNVQEDVSGPLPADWPVQRFEGPAGTTFLTDTRGLHNGYPPTRAPRLLLWARWCIGDPPPAYKNDQTHPVPWRGVVAQKPDPAIQRATRLVVNWDHP